MVLTLPGSKIKSIQRGSISVTGTDMSNTATVTAVTVTKSTLNQTGKQQINAINSESYYCALTLTNSTTVTATRRTAGGVTTTVSFELIELY